MGMVAIPALILLLLRKEEEKGSPLTKEDVLSIRDNAVWQASGAVTMTYHWKTHGKTGARYDPVSLVAAHPDDRDRTRLDT